MSTFIEYGGCRIPRRPKTFDPQVLNAVFNAIRPELYAYLNKDKEAVELLRKPFLHIHSTDGYDIARHMEMYSSLGGCEETVAIFSYAPFNRVLRNFINMWIDQYHILPLLKIGDRVKWNYLEGVIVVESDRNFPDNYGTFPGCYLIHMDNAPDGQNIVVPWEECVLVDSVDGKLLKGED